MILAELKVIQVLLLHEGDTHAIEAGKQPAASGAFLVSYWLGLVNLRGNIRTCS